MKIEELKHKVKILLEYPKYKRYEEGSYLTLSKDELSKLHLRIFLKDGKEIYVDDIRYITLKVKQDALGRKDDG